jgi:hypothetical protein
VAEVVADANAGTQSNLNYDNLPLTESNGTYVNAGTWQTRWTARRLMQISNDFESVFGQAAINTRIRPVLSNIPIPSVQASQLAFINAVFGAPSKFFYAVAAATYANMDGPGDATNTLNGGNNNPNLSVTDVLNNLSVNGYALTSLYDALDAVANQYGLQMDGYESGPDLSGFQDTTTSKVQAELSPLFSTFLEQYYQAWYASGGGTIIYYTGGVRAWGQPYGDFQMSDTQEDLFNAKEIGFRADESSERAPLAPAALGNLSATPISSTQVNLSWGSASAGAIEYRVEASTSSSFSANLVTQIAPVGSTSWSFTGLSSGITYYFRVIAASTAGDAAPSSTASAATTGTAAVPAAPFNVGATAVSSSQINVTWADNSLIENGFTITVASDSGFVNVLQTLTAAAGATSIPVYDLNGGTTYYIEVAAFNAAGTSAAATAPATTTPLPVPLALYNFNESSGSTVLDSGSGTPANGTIVGGVTRIAGPYTNNGALAFNGSTGYVNLGTPTKLNLQGQITIGAWIKPTSVSSQGDIISQDWDGLDTPFFLDLSNSTTVNFGTYRYYGSSGPNVQATGTSSVSLTNGQWHYIAGVYDGQDFKVYIDGVLAGETADPYGVTYGTEPTNIGRDSNDGGGSYDYFNGDIADLVIYSNGLSAADILKLSPPPSDTWTGAVSTAWSTPGNWSAAAIPGAPTNVVINSGIPTASSAFTVAALTLNGGTLSLGSSSGGFTVTSLTITGSGTLNIENNHLIINYGSTDPKTAILQNLANGDSSGKWTGTGIDSSTAAGSGGRYGVGFVDGADGVSATLTSGQIEIAYALYGDANLDGKVDIADFNIISAHFGLTVTGGWEQGDFNYSGTVDISDFNLFSPNFGLAAQGTAVVLPSTSTNTTLQANTEPIKTTPPIVSTTILKQKQKHTPPRWH